MIPPLRSTLVLPLLLVSVAPSVLEAQDAIPPEVMAGTSLGDAERDALEATVQADPDDQGARLRLVGYYLTHRGPARAPHVLWVIRNLPESQVAGSPFCTFFKRQDPESYQEGLRLWEAHAKPEAATAEVLLNAASYVDLEDTAGNERLLRRGMTAFPDDPRFPEHLARASTRRQPPRHAEALALFERALQATLDETERFYLLSDVAKSAVDAAEPARAKAFATELLALAGSIHDWNTGNAVHHGNLVLGRVALQAGDVELATAHLLAAGRTSGSPQLDSFGPNMVLARDLLARDQRAPVLAYLELCAKFWKDARLETWRKQVQAGQVPDFGANLLY